MFVRSSLDNGLIAATITMFAMLGGATAGAADNSEPAAAFEQLDLYRWQTLPVFHNGRKMPLQTFARSACETICGSENPKLDLKRECSEDEYKSNELAAARGLFPGSKPRRFEASELVLSWLVEPAVWEDIPFLSAAHEDLRKLLDVPLVSPEGKRLQFVSPRTVAQSEALHERIKQLHEKQRNSGAAGERFEPQGIDRRVMQLGQAFQLYRQLTSHPIQDHRARGRFISRSTEALPLWRVLDQSLAAFRNHAGATQFVAMIEPMDRASRKILEAIGRGEFPIDEVEPSVIAFRRGAEQVSTYLGDLKSRLFEQPPDWPREQLENLQYVMTQAATKAHILARHAREMHIALYDNDDPLRIVPALNAAALEKNRDAADDAQPWLSWQTVLYGSDELLADYPPQPLHAVRQAAAELQRAYVDRNNPKRDTDIQGGAAQLSHAMRMLADQIEPRRGPLKIAERDEALMVYTKYPSQDITNREVRYNNMDPFMWSWVISLLALVCFALSFGKIRTLMFWLAVAVLASGMLWTAYGFYLRISITRWAPVTNMYETVVYVPFFVSLLGAWFLLLPLFWDAARAAWRLTAIPGTVEAAALSSEQLQLLNPSTWRFWGWAMLAARTAMMGGLYYVLTQAPVYDGGNTILRLSPRSPLNQLMSNPNDLIVWGVGLCVLLATMWFLPRLMLTAAATVVLVPRSLRGRLGTALAKVYPRWPFGAAATFVAFAGAFVAWYSPVLDEGFTPLQPVLRSNFWLTIHVLTIVSSYGAGALAWGLGNLALGYYLFGTYRPITLADARDEEIPLDSATRLAAPQALFARLAREEDGSLFSATVGTSATVATRRVGARPSEACAVLAAYCYKAMQVAVLLLASGTILGGLWADVSWGRFWGWDPKEVFALVSLLVYLAVLHGRYAGLFGDFGTVAGTILGGSAIIFSWYGVNFVLGVGLHSYGFGAGGQAEVGTAVLLNWVFLGAAALRYWYETRV